MNRPRKKKELSLMEELKELDLLGEGDVVEIPDLENDDLIEENSMSVIVRCLNPTVHKIGGLVKALPPIWGMEDRVRGRGVGDDRVQFIFESEGDLYHVLYRGPWFVNGWIVTIGQWKPNPGPDFLKRILFWVRIKGIPIHWLKKQTVDSIIGPLGKIDAVELHAKNSPSLEYVRARVWIKADEPLQFVKTSSFRTREVARIELTYEKLLKVCFLYKRLSHDQSACSFQIEEQQYKGEAKSTRKKETVKAKGKGKGKIVDEGPSRTNLTQKKGRISSSQSDPGPRVKSVKDRLKWSGLQGGITESQFQQTWSPTGRLLETPAKSKDCQSIDELKTNLSKRQRASSSGEKANNKERVGSGEKLHHSPSVFERLGNNGQSDHSAHVAAQFSNHSASSVAANCPHSSGATPGNESSASGDSVHLARVIGEFALDGPEALCLGSSWQEWRPSVAVEGERQGDFNELVDPTEKIGGALIRDSSCIEFRQMLNVCGLWEVKHVGYQFSWFGNRNDKLVQCQLDRTVANQAWMDMFPQAQATYLQKICSDHNPLINSLMGMKWKTWAGFKYDKRWVQREGFTDLMAQFWIHNASSTEKPMMEKLGNCRKEISKWKRQAKPSSAVRIQELQFQIDAAKRHIPFNPPQLKEHQWITAKPAKGVQMVKWNPPQHHRQIPSLKYVKDLLVANWREWNLNLLYTLLPDEVVHQIVQIRPRGCNSKDSYAWDYTNDGHYSVKSGYWVLMEVIRRRNSPQEVVQHSLSPIFQQVWKTDSSPKIQHFLWRCVSNCISVAGNLAHMHLARDGSCIRCPSHAETVNHLLFKCAFARLVWVISPIPAPPGGEWSESIYQNMYCILNIKQEHPHLGEEGKVAPWILWRLWKSRNDYIFKGREYSAQEVVRRAKDDEEEWRMRKEKRSQPTPAIKPAHNRTKWLPPQQDWVKCNTDGAWSSESTNCGIGWVLRDHEKKVFWLGTRSLPQVDKVLEVESESLRWAVLYVARFNYRKVIFETDSQHLVSLIRGETENNHLRPIIQDIKHLLQRFEDSQVTFTYREGNGAADRVAKESLSFENHVPKLYSIVPIWVKPFVELDNL
ncbi:unnamed protein product [Arabidopsis halleri]